MRRLSARCRWTTRRRSLSAVALAGVPPVRKEGQMECPFCHKQVKLTEIVRSAHHVLGCRHCFGKPSPLVQAEAIVARVSRRRVLMPITEGAFGAFGGDREDVR